VSAKALIRAIAALALLLVLWGAFALFRGSIGDAGTGLALPRLSAADVNRVAIVRPQDTVVLSREAGAGWRVNGYRADGRQVDQLFRALTDTGASTELLARNAASHGRLGVDGAGRRVVFARDADTLLALVVGDQGRAYQTAYVRLEHEDEVFLYRGPLPGLLSREQDAWRDRQIARVASDSVQAVSITREGRSETLRRAEAAWMIGSHAADSAAVGRLLRALGDVTAIGFATAAEADSVDFARPWRRLAVVGLAGDTLLALDVDSTGAGYWVRRAGSSDVFRVDFWRVDQLIPPFGTLRGGSP
jgi:hypothetical protein